jgi:hypothetical protein
VAASDVVAGYPVAAAQALLYGSALAGIAGSLAPNAI